MTQATHDEVIAYTVALDADLDRLIARYDRELRVSQENTLDELIYDTTLALRSIATKAKVSNLANRAGLERHKPEIRYLLDECGGSFDTEQEAIDSCDRLGDDPLPVVTTFVICAYCGGLNAEIMENADEWVYDPSVYFPCSSYTDIAEPIRSVM